MARRRTEDRRCLAIRLLLWLHKRQRERGGSKGGVDVFASMTFPSLRGAVFHLLLLLMLVSCDFGTV
jgi:hypothetical protein